MFNPFTASFILDYTANSQEGFRDSSMQNTTHLESEYICNFISVLRGLRQHNISILEQFYKTAR